MAPSQATLPEGPRGVLSRTSLGTLHSAGAQRLSLSLSWPGPFATQTLPRVGAGGCGPRPAALLVLLGSRGLPLAVAPGTSRVTRTCQPRSATDTRGARARSPPCALYSCWEEREFLKIKRYKSFAMGLEQVMGFSVQINSNKHVSAHTHEPLCVCVPCISECVHEFV